MTQAPRPGGPVPVVVALAAATVLIGSAALFVALQGSPSGPDGPWTAPTIAEPLAGSAGRSPAGSPRTAAAEPAAPTAVRIPRLGVESSLLALDTDPAGALVPPESAEVAGWYRGGAVPGERGPALIAGHVDSTAGPGVFYRLRELRAGDEVIVSGPAGDAVFRVVWSESVGKTEFPTVRVYGPTPVPELRLVTCGGTFDRRTGHYRDNIIVHAELITRPG